MQMAELVASRSTCLRRHVGAVVVRNNRVISTGYNGSPRGLRHCSEVGCIRDQMKIPSGERHELCRGVHAELNAVVYAGRHELEDAEIYVTIFPCAFCAKTLINAGIRRIYYVGDYSDDLSKRLLQESGIELVKMR